MTVGEESVSVLDDNVSSLADLETYKKKGVLAFRSYP